MAGKLVLVAGNIGTGKTSLTERLGDRLGWRTAYESVIDNPYLSDFYQDMSAWSFHLQIFFLGHRAQQHLELVGDNKSAIADRSIYEDVKIFARAEFKGVAGMNGDAWGWFSSDYRSAPLKGSIEIIVGSITVEVDEEKTEIPNFHEDAN